MNITWPTATTARVAAAAGWTPDRSIDVSAELAKLRSQGFHMSELSAELLGSFGGLRFSPPNVPEAVWGSDLVIFEPLESVDDMYAAYEEVELILGCRMSPIGVSSHSDIVVLEDGRLVSYSFVGVRVLGNSFAEGIDLALRRYRWPEFLIEY